jgi:quercetin dioxygenase-like cupin family protein
MTTMNTKGFRNFKGTLVSLRLSANDNADGLSIIEHKMPRGETTPLHIHHNEDEVFHILRGAIRFEVGGETRLAHAGDILVAPKGVPHRFIVESLQGAHCLTIMHGRDFETLVLDMSSPVAVEFMPHVLEVNPDMVAALGAAAARNHIDIIGPPLAA